MSGCPVDYISLEQDFAFGVDPAGNIYSEKQVGLPLPQPIAGRKVEIFPEQGELCIWGVWFVPTIGVVVFRSVRIGDFPLAQFPLSAFNKDKNPIPVDWGRMTRTMPLVLEAYADEFRSETVTGVRGTLYGHREKP